MDPKIFRSTHLYRTKHSSTINTTCLTCSPPSDLPLCLHSSVELSPSFSGYLLYCKGPSIPYTALFSLPSNTLVKILDRNQHLERALSVKKSVLQTKQGYFLEVLRRSNSDDLKEKPLLLTLTAGVPHIWSCDFSCWLADYLNLVVADVETVNDITSLATEKLSSVMNSLTALSYVHPNKIAVYSHGYQGFLALSSLLEKGLNINCGVVVAPVTDWRLTSPYISERLKLPVERLNLMERNLTSLSGKQLLLVHGMRDRNILLANSLLLSEKLAQQGIIFSQQFYPEAGHKMKKKVQFFHMKTVTRFLEDCLVEKQEVKEKGDWTFSEWFK